MSSVFIATPNMGWICTPLARQFGDWERRLGVKICTPEGLKPMSFARNWCVDLFLQTDCDFFWLLDADIAPAPGILEALLKADKDIIAAPVRVLKVDTDEKLKPVPMLMMRGDDHEFYSVNGSGVERIDRAGFACILFKRWIFETAISCPWFEERPWGKYRGTDFIFCEKLDKLEIPLYGHFDLDCKQKVETFI